MLDIPDAVAREILRAVQQFLFRCAEEERKRVVPSPPPRYDDVYYEALEEAERD